MPVAARGKTWARAYFRGFENLLIPSFSTDLRRLDEAGIRLDVRSSIGHGAFSSACVLDSGLTPEEQRAFIAIACDEAQGRIGISVALGAGQPDRIVELLAYAEASGVSHAHLGCPRDFAPASDSEVVAHIARIAQASELPLSLVGERFSFPNLHASGLPLASLEQIAGFDPIIALELDSLDAGLLEEACERFGERLLISSPHLSLLPLLVKTFGVQWSGPWAIEAVQSPAARHAVDFFEHLMSGNFTAAMGRYWEIAPALGASARIAATYAHTGARHLPLIKYQQWLSGGNGGLTRQPVMRLYQRDMQAIRQGLAAVGVICKDADSAFFMGRSGAGEAA